MKLDRILKTAPLSPAQKRGVQFSYRIIKVDTDQRLVTGVVYTPWVLDTHGHYMSDVEVERTAHAFLKENRQKQVDVSHNNQLIDAVVVESYIERIGSKEVPLGSWVATTKINDEDSWDRVKKGELNGYSMEIMSYMVEHNAVITFDSWVMGETEPDPFDGHTHTYLVKMDEEGNVEKGFTSKAGSDNHSHRITRLSVTEPYNNTTHRFII